MFTPSSSGLVGTAYNRHAASGHARHQSLASAPLPFQKRAPLEQHPIGAASHGWHLCGSFLCPDVSIPAVSKSAAIPMCPFGATAVGRPRQTRSLTNSARRARAPSTPTIPPRSSSRLSPVAGPAPSLDERIRVTSNIGGVHSLEAPGFNPPYRRKDV